MATAVEKWHVNMRRRYRRCQNSVSRVMMAPLTQSLVLVLGCVTMLSMGEVSMAFTLTSPSFTANGEIPAKHTCEGSDVSPALAWSNLPDGTRSLALIVDDPDAPDPNAPRMTWVHWVLYAIPPTASGLPEGVRAEALAPGTRQGRNDWKVTGYRGPCPPIGRHRYVHKMYALDIAVPDLGAATKAELERAMAGHVLAEAHLIGTYQKRDAGEAGAR